MLKFEFFNPFKKRIDERITKLHTLIFVSFIDKFTYSELL